MQDIKQKFSSRIRELRKKNNLTQLELADLSGIDYKHIQKIEGRSPKDIRLTSLEKLAKAFKMSLSEFLDF